MTAVTEKDVQHFRKHGWAVVPKLVSEDQLAILHSTWEKGFADPPDVNETYGQAKSETPKDVVSNTDPEPILRNVRELNRYYDEVKPVCMDPRVGETVKRFLGVEHVRLFSETYLNKPPGARKTPWHQDWPLQPFDRRDTVNVWVALDDMTPEQGALQVVSGSHRLGPLYMPEDFGNDMPLQQILNDDDVEFLWSLASEDDVNSEGVPVRQGGYSAGDALIFYGLTLHGAPPNQTDKPRKGYTRTVISSETRYTGMPYLKTDSVGLSVGRRFELDRYPVIA